MNIAEKVMLMLVRGYSEFDVAIEMRMSGRAVQVIRERMCGRAERDIQLARLKLWRETARAA